MKQMFVRIALEATGRLAFGDNFAKAREHLHDSSFKQRH